MDPKLVALIDAKVSSLLQAHSQAE